MRCGYVALAPRGTNLEAQPRRLFFLCSTKLADKEAKREATLKALSTETDPKMQRKIRASARRYKAIPHTDLRLPRGIVGNRDPWDDAAEVRGVVTGRYDCQ